MKRIWVNRQTGVPLILTVKEVDINMPILYRDNHNIMVGLFTKFSRKGYAIYEEYGTHADYERSRL